MPNTRIVIEVSGGVVQDVHMNSAVEYIVVDHDDLGEEDSDDACDQALANALAWMNGEIELPDPV